jgi:hypothetical protein
VDTSIFVAHFLKSNTILKKLLNSGNVVCHPFIIGELACGNIKNRAEILSLMQSLPMVEQANQDEILKFIENKKLMGKGLGLIDVHLLASAILSDVLLWSFDKNLSKIATKLNINFIP